MAVLRSTAPAARASRRAWRVRGLFLLSFALLLVLWQLVVVAFHVPAIIFPTPLDTARALWFGLAGGSYLPSIYATLEETFLGFAIGALAGTVLGVVISQVPLLGAIIMPYIVALQTTPKVAIAPVITIWLGLGLQSKIVVTALICFFPVVINVITGLESTESKQIDLMRALCASRWQIFRYLKVPNALPLVFAGFDIGIVLSVLGAIVAEFVGATRGLGYLILQFQFTMSMANVFSVVALLAAIGIGLHQVLVLVQRRVVYWRRPEQEVIGA